MFRGYLFQSITLLIFTIQMNYSFGQEIDIIKSDELFQMVDECDENHTVQVYNFWAKWCAPCIKELPQFEQLNNINEEVNVTLISLDDVDELNNKVKPFVIKKEIKSRVVLLDETDFNEIINRVDARWSGAIPGTLIVDCRTSEKYFYEGEFKENELNKTIEDILTSQN